LNILYKRNNTRTLYEQYKTQ